MTKQDKTGTRGPLHLLPTCRHRLLPGRRQARLPASSTVGGRLTTNQQTRQACPVPAQSGAQIRVPSSWVLCRLFPLVGALRAQLCPSWEPPRQGRLRREGSDGRWFHTENGFPLTAQSRPTVPSGAKEARAGPSPTGRTVGTDFQGTAELRGQPSGPPCSTGGPCPHQPLQSGSFQFRSPETHVAAGVRGPCDYSLHPLRERRTVLRTAVSVRAASFSR